MQNVTCAVVMVAMTATIASAQTPPPAQPPQYPVECTENPFKPGCPLITIMPGAAGTGLKPQGNGAGGIDIKGLRPMDKPSFDRDSLRLPKATY